MSSPVGYLNSHLKDNIFAQYVYRKWIYPRLATRSDTDQLLFPTLKMRTAIDVGANAGTYALALAPLCKRLLCFEPVPFMGRLLHKLLGGISHVSIYKTALSDSNGTATLSIPLRSGGTEAALATLRTVFPGANNIEVRTQRLDDFWQEHPDVDVATIDFIKVDVEGAEGMVIAGMNETIQRALPVLLVEIELRHNAQSVAIFESLYALGYETCVSRTGGVLEPITVTQDKHLIDVQKKEDLESERFSFKIGDTRRYLNNFWFIHPKSALAGQLKPFIHA